MPLLLVALLSCAVEPAAVDLVWPAESSFRGRVGTVQVAVVNASDEALDSGRIVAHYYDTNGRELSRDMVHFGKWPPGATGAVLSPPAQTTKIILRLEPPQQNPANFMAAKKQPWFGQYEAEMGSLERPGQTRLVYTKGL